MSQKLLLYMIMASNPATAAMAPMMLLMGGGGNSNMLMMMMMMGMFGGTTTTSGVQGTPMSLASVGTGLSSFIPLLMLGSGSKRRSYRRRSYRRYGGGGKGYMKGVLAGMQAAR